MIDLLPARVKLARLRRAMRRLEARASDPRRHDFWPMLSNPHVCAMCCKPEPAHWPLSRRCWRWVMEVIS